MSIVLKKPDDARAQPSSLMREEEDYNNIFNPNYPIQLYLQCVKIMKKVEEFLRNTNIEYSGGINNIKFHLAMFATLLLLNTSEVKPDKIANLSVDGFDDELLEQCLQEVVTIYQQMGDNDQVAKGPEFVQKLVERLSQMIYQGRLIT